MKNCLKSTSLCKTLSQDHNAKNQPNLPFIDMKCFYL